jgi:hypothetical protein
MRNIIPIVKPNKLFNRELFIMGVCHIDIGKNIAINKYKNERILLNVNSFILK